MNTFTYSPLRLSQSTRLFEILPGDPKSEIRCHMFENDLNQLPNSGYTALSYCWGTMSKKSRIMLNGLSFPVTGNLHAALEVLRTSYAGNLFWVDAICIDQSSLPERSSQVLKMRKIYEHASRVIVWLGTGSNAITEAAHWIGKIHNFWQSRTLADGNDKETLYNICVQRAGELFDNIDGVVDVVPFHGLIEMLTQPWFERVWIIQEATTPNKDMFVHCGDAIISWDTLIVATRIITHLVLRPELRDFLAPAPSLENQSLRRLFNLDKQRQYQKPVLKFMQVLAKYRHFKATDERDKIYALRGLAADLSDHDLTPDYSLSSSIVFAQTTEHLIVSQQSFECLGLCDFSTRNPSQPSWVPSWSSQVVRHPLAKRPIHDNYQLDQGTVYKAATTLSSTCDHKRQWQCRVENGHVLHVQGFRVNVVDRTAGFEIPEASSITAHNFWWAEPGPNSSTTGALYDVRVPESQMYRDSSETLAMAYSRTIVADVAKSGGDRVRGFNITLDHWRHVQHYTHPQNESKYRKEWGSLLFSIVGRCLFRTREGYLGLGPVDVQPGDEVCVFFGADVLYLLRPVGKFYHLIGECYTHGLMDGEVLSLLDSTSREVETFAII